MKAPGKSLGVLIIARKNSQSAHMLFKTLEDHFNVEIVNATTPSDLNDSNFYPAKNVETLEMAISISHHRARTRALTLGYEWTLILEEDAIVNFDYFQINKEVRAKMYSLSPLLSYSMFLFFMLFLLCYIKHAIRVKNKVKESFDKVQFLFQSCSTV